MLRSANERDAQFALDSLRLMETESRPMLVCQLASQQPLKVKHLYWVNRGPNFELFAQYEPSTVGEAAALVLGAPPGSQAPCDGASEKGRADCAQRWTEYLKRPKGR